MRNRFLPALAGLALAAALASPASAAGPDLGTVDALDAGGLVYTATVLDGRTTVAARRATGSAPLRQATIPGRFGIPLVTFNGHAEGLSNDGRLLVLADRTTGTPLRARSGFVTVDTRTLRVMRRLDLRGHFAYDTVSPNGRFLYLIEHFSDTDVLRYRVRAYDLRRGRLLPRVIVDKRQPDEPMSGMPSARLTSPDGRKVFTLYVNPEHPFVHLLDTVAQTAFCIDLPHTADMREIETATLRLGRGGGKLTIIGLGGHGARHVVDVRALRVT
jgi:hypothetical protein